MQADMRLRNIPIQYPHNSLPSWHEFLQAIVGPVFGFLTVHLQFPCKNNIINVARKSIYYRLIIKDLFISFRKA